ncbi:Flp pilus assembly protein RcpC/CpaB [plant metagenome]|uniref:Flp pilus assembly protein RcpC/CpaB n=1 Tax=plant metagenome TaxID=1297885 RepID=A0A484SIJ6_9ZZZZ
MSSMTRILAILLVVFAVLLGGFAWFLASRPVTRPQPVAPPPVAQAQPDTARVPVVVAKKALEAGAPIPADAIEVVQWPVAPATGFTDPGQVRGQFLRLDVAPGEPVLASSLLRGLQEQLHEGERAVTVPIDEVTGAAGRVRPGDWVDVFMTFNQGGEVGQTQSRLLQPRVRVLAYGERVLGGAEPQAAGRQAAQQANAAPRTALLAVPLVDVNDLILASRNGRLQLVLRPTGDADGTDPALFVEPAAVLSARTGLDASARERLREPANRAYAGTGLGGIAGAAPVAARPAGAPRPAGRSVEVLRGNRSENVPY